MFARQQAAALMQAKEQLDGMNIPVVVIGSSTPEQAAAFVKRYAFAAEVYVDPTLRSYQAFQLERGFFRTLGPASLARGIKTLKAGFRQGRSAGDLWQQGGTFVIGPGNQLLFAHRNSGAGDHPDMEAVISVCGKKPI